MPRLTLLPFLGILLAGCGDGTSPSNTAYIGPGFPQLTSAGGPVLSPMRLTVITAVGDTSSDSLFLFTRRLPSSSWWHTVSQPYGVTIQSVDTVTGPAIADRTLTALQIQTYISSVIASSPSLAATSNSLYLLVLPSGYTFDGNYCGFHSTFSTGPGVWAAVERCGGFASWLEELTNVASHEIIEAATDPLGNGWVLSSASQPWKSSPWAAGDCAGCSHEEVADFCEGTRYFENGFSYQRVYANTVATGGDPCIPSQTVPYFIASTDAAWYAPGPQSGDTIRIPIVGRASATVSDWFTSGQVTNHGAHAPAWALARAGMPPSAFPTLNAGVQETLRVWFPGGASRGDYAVFAIKSALNSACELVPSTSDCFHLWSVGAYIP